MTTRYIHATKGTGSGAFDDPAQPARTVGDALRAAAAGDTIEIQDAAVYREDELIITQALTITSSYLVAHPKTNPADGDFTAGKRFPTITTKGRHRVIRIVGGPDTRASFGPVKVRGIRIVGGNSVHTAADPALGCGGGIAVIDADNVTIERCIIRENHTHAADINPWPEADRVALRDAVVGLASDILSPTAEAGLNAMIDYANMLLGLSGKSPLPLRKLSRAAVLSGLAAEFDSLLPSGRPNAWLGGQAFGGGVAFVWSNGELNNCLIRGNTAEGRGAGVAVCGYGWPTISRCWIDANVSGTAGRRDGGGIGCSVSFPSRLTRNLNEIELVRFLTGKVSSVRKTVCDPLSSITMSDLMWLLNPSEPNPAIRGVTPIILEAMAGHGKVAVLRLIYFYMSSALSLHTWEAWRQVEIENARRNWIIINHCTLTKNTADDDGGGLYASVMSRVWIEYSVVIHNLARSSGGGIRLSMGSSGILDHCELTANTVLVDVRRDPKKKLVNGGGGVSCRNVDLTLTTTTIGPGSIGPASATSSWNVTTDHAGGGLAYQADTEGVLAGIPDLWTSIQHEVFAIKKVTVRIDRGCWIGGNGAGFDEEHRPLPTADRAKGGGVWFLQGEFPDAPRLDLTIESVRKTVHGNTALTRHYRSKEQPGLVVATADDVCLQDEITHREWTEANYGPIIDTSGALKFSS